jgi:AP2 domain
VTVEIPLTRGLLALVDDEDAAAVLAAGKWHAKVCRWTTYARRTVRRSDGRRTALALHTFLTGWALVDHANGDGLDCRRANLRPATTAQNSLNAHRRRDNTSGFRGVWWDKTSKRWRAQLKHEGRRIDLGCHDDAVSAARAYDEAARRHAGKFARLNFR